MLLGRDLERSAIDRLIQNAAAGRGGGMVLNGEPGIGKTALLDYAAERAHLEPHTGERAHLEHHTGEPATHEDHSGERPSLKGDAEVRTARPRVLRSGGVEPETDLPFAVLHRLLLPILPLRKRIPDPQSRSLAVVFGLADGPAPDRFMVSLATLSLLSEAAGDGPLLCLVDDAHWADVSSLDTLAFVARRLANEPIAMILAGRPKQEPQSAERLAQIGLTTLEVGRLNDEASRRLLAARTGVALTPAQQSRLLTVAAGNPLAILELPDTIANLPTSAIHTPAAASNRAGDSATARPIPLTAGLQEAYLERIRSRSDEAQRLLLLIAADGAGQRKAVREAAAKLGLSDRPLDTGELDDLMLDDLDRLAFRHPLIRSAVYHGAPAGERRRIHAALAAALRDDPIESHRRAWHLGQAAEAPDEGTAHELETAAALACQRSGHAAAVASLARAAELSASTRARARRLVAAATLAWQAGDLDHMGNLLDQAERSGDLDEEAALTLAELRALREILAGTPADALTILAPVLSGPLRVELRRAISLLLLLGEAGFRSNTPTVWVEVSDWLDQVDLDGDSPEDALARMLQAVHGVVMGKEPNLGPEDFDRVEKLDDPVLLIRAGGMCWALGEFERGRQLRRLGIEQARATGAIGTLAFGLQFEVSDLASRSRFGAAQAFAEEGYHFALDSGQPNTACWHLASLALIAALRGQEQEARRLAYEVLTTASTHNLAAAAASAQRALGMLDLLAGRYAEAAQRFSAMTQPDRSRPPTGLVLHSLPDLVEALLRSDQRDRAVEEYARYARWVELTSAPGLEALAARCRALFSGGDDAVQAFEQALRLHAEADSAMDEARTQLLFGQHLRRERRRSDARPHLRAAMETFQRIGAASWAEQARGELRATGDAAGEGERLLESLTAQEMRIALTVSEGLTNREIAAQLFISPRTVDYHLRKVFQKVGISSRGELTRLVLLDSDDVRAHAG